MASVNIRKIENGYVVSIEDQGNEENNFRWLQTEIFAQTPEEAGELIVEALTDRAENVKKKIDELIG